MRKSRASKSIRGELGRGVDVAITAPSASKLSVITCTLLLSFHNHVRQTSQKSAANATAGQSAETGFSPAHLLPKAPRLSSGDAHGIEKVTEAS